VLGSKIPVDDAHVRDAQVFTDTMHVETVGRQQPVKKLDICRLLNQGNMTSLQ